jgi:hypothetical protein
VDLLRLFALAGCLLSAMLGGLYATTHASRRSEPGAAAAAVLASASTPLAPSSPAVLRVAPPIPSGLDVPLDALDGEGDLEAFVDAETGVTLGPLTLASTEASRVEPSEATPRSTARARRSAPRPAPGPRLDPDPGRHVILTARGMMSRGETVRGSCYAYLSEVFERAGHEGWRTRTVVYQAGPNGPYADLDLIRPGDWLYIVNDPDSTPVGTHSVLFVGWEDRASGYARTISHAGWAAGASPGRESHYDVTRTYRIIRPRMGE